jgi:hypothetical protein
MARKVIIVRRDNCRRELDQWNSVCEFVFGLAWELVYQVLRWSFKSLFFVIEWFFRFLIWGFGFIFKGGKKKGVGNGK